jgi:hypothetical protein
VILRLGDTTGHVAKDTKPLRRKRKVFHLLSPTDHLIRDQPTIQDPRSPATTASPRRLVVLLLDVARFGTRTAKVTIYGWSTNQEHDRLENLTRALGGSNTQLAHLRTPTRTLAEKVIKKTLHDRARQSTAKHQRNQRRPVHRPYLTEQHSDALPGEARRPKVQTAIFTHSSEAQISSFHLKVRPCRTWLSQHADPADTILYVGLDWPEPQREPAITRGWAPWTVRYPMREPPHLSKQDMLDWCTRLGVQPPRLYELGFGHNNFLDYAARLRSSSSPRVQHGCGRCRGQGSAKTRRLHR